MLDLRRNNPRGGIARVYYATEPNDGTAAMLDGLGLCSTEYPRAEERQEAAS